jgi:hypothetical protein
MVAVAWGIAGLDRFDPTSTLGSAITLGRHPRLILIMAVAGFAMLAGLAADEGVQPRYRARVRAAHRRLRDFRRRAGTLSAILLFALASVLAVILLVILIVLLAVLVR